MQSLVRASLLTDEVLITLFAPESFLQESQVIFPVESQRRRSRSPQLI